MAHSYHTLQQWNQWLGQRFLGQCLLEAERNALKRLLSNHFGKHGLLIGVENQSELLRASVISYHSLLSPLIHHAKESSYIESTLHDLPILTGTIDLVLLPHTLEWVDNPHQLLAEACRIIKPEGLIAITGFNPYSMWGMKKRMMQHKGMPWSANFMHANKIKNWLKLSDFALERQMGVLFRPPLSHPPFYHKLAFFDQFGNRCLPMFSSAYVLLARAKVVPLTPIKLQWKQAFVGVRMPGNITGHIARRRP